MAKIIMDENIPRDVEEWLSKKGFATALRVRLTARDSKKQSFG